LQIDNRDRFLHHGSSRYFCINKACPAALVEHIGSIPRTLVSRHGLRIVRQHFQRQLAAGKLPGARFGPLQQGLRDALTAVFRTRHHIVDIEQRFGGKGGKTSEAIDQANRHVTIASECTVEGWQTLEFTDEIGFGVGRQTLATTHRVTRIVVEQLQPGRRNSRIFEVDRVNHNHQVSPEIRNLTGNRFSVF
jgi:hypothetical protein